MSRVTRGLPFAFRYNHILRQHRPTWVHCTQQRDGDAGAGHTNKRRASILREPGVQAPARRQSYSAACITVADAGQVSRDNAVSSNSGGMQARSTRSKPRRAK